MARTTEDVGHVVAINIYPIKSMAGQPLEQAKLGWQGFADDRRYAFQCTDDTSGLPWLSARECTQLILYKAIVDGTAGVSVETPSGLVLPATSPDLLSELTMLAGRPLRLTQLWRGTYDAAPLSIITTASVKDVGAMVGRGLEVDRFRANIVVEANDNRAFPEDRWINQSIVIGDSPTAPRVRVNRKDPRCRIINLSPFTAEEDPSVLHEVVRQRKNNIGVYGTPEFPGTVSVGDVVRLIKS